MRSWQVLFCSCLVGSVIASAHAELNVEAGYVRALLPGADSTAAYMTLHNDESSPVVVTQISSPVAGKITMHNTMNHNGMMHMMGVESFTIPAKGELLLSPGGMHLMLEAITASLAPGQTVQLTLGFADGRQQSVNLPVKSVLDE